MLRNLSMAKSELECLLHEEKIIQHNELLARGLLELSSTCHTHPVSPNSYHILFKKIIENKITALQEKTSKSFKVDDGPCMKSIQLCLNRLAVSPTLLWRHLCRKSCSHNSEGTIIHV